MGDLIGAVGGLIPGAGAVVGVAGAAFGFWKGRKLGKLVKEVFDVINVYRTSRLEESEGGTAISSKEMDKLVKELEEAAIAAVGVLKK